GCKAISAGVDACGEDFVESVEAESTRWLHFRRQHVIDGYVVDFYCHAAGLVVEVDGAIHTTQAAEDKERERAIGLRGLRVIRFTNDRVLHDLPTCLAEIQATAKNVEAPR